MYLNIFLKHNTYYIIIATNKSHMLPICYSGHIWNIIICIITQLVKIGVSLHIYIHISIEVGPYYSLNNSSRITKYIIFYQFVDLFFVTSFFQIVKMRYVCLKQITLCNILSF